MNTLIGLSRFGEANILAAMLEQTLMSSRHP